jgi:hypothetical protein
MGALQQFAFKVDKESLTIIRNAPNDTPIRNTSYGLFSIGGDSFPEFTAAFDDVPPFISGLALR